MNRHTLAALILIFIIPCSVFATHNRAGEITYVQIGPLTIRATVTTYTRTSSQAADRDTIDFTWGDGTGEKIPRSNGGGTILPNDIKINTYTAEHTYPGRSTYTMGFLDPNRIGGILNVNYPQSVDVPFFLSSTFTLLDPQFQGTNSSAILLQAPIDFACMGEIFIHNPNAYDPDGDSLAYELIAPMQGVNENVPKYLFPDEILPGINNVISLNAQTGDFIWNAPPQQGTYNIAFKIKEYRKGVLINSLIRDMQVIIRACENSPPKIESENEICVIAGEKINLPIKVTDIDLGQKIQLTSSGGPLVLGIQPAVVIGPNGYNVSPLEANLEWQTSCEHISPQYYQIVLRAVDNYFADTAGLASLKTVRIKVVGPQPQNVSAESMDGNSILVSWDKPYACEATLNNYFHGFSVWRKEASNPFVVNKCQEGLAGKGYEMVATLTSEYIDDRYVFEDKNVISGVSYCYRILGEFAKVTNSGFLYNRVSSLPSEEACAQLARDLPLITKVSIDKTDDVVGEIHVRWAKPLRSDFDVTKYPGPYKYELSRKIKGVGDFSVINGATIITNDLFDVLDTNYYDKGLNTVTDQYEYRIQLYYANGVKYMSSPSASSIYVKPNPSDMQVLLTWDFDVPWANYSYQIYRKNSAGTFENIANTVDKMYRDIALINGQNYCYKIKALGTYSIDHIEFPLENFSQEVCGTAEDNIAPCAPDLEVTNFCDNPDLFQQDNFFNRLTWNDPNLGCDYYSEAASFNIYYSIDGNQDFQLVQNVGSKPLRYDHLVDATNIGGCYYVTSLDSIGNESLPSNTACVDNCPIYELPNTFTPNGDGANEIFRPTKNLFVASVEMKIYNEWGNLVFETTSPTIDWDGSNGNGSFYAAGTYYYLCKVNELQGSGKVLKGFINLIR